MRIRINYYYKECMNKFHEYNADWKRLIIKETHSMITVTQCLQRGKNNQWQGKSRPWLLLKGGFWYTASILFITLVCVYMEIFALCKLMSLFVA